MTARRRHAARPIRTAELLARVPTRRRAYRDHRLFADPAAQRSLDTFGYHVTDRILDDQQIASLLQVCERWLEQEPGPDDSRFRTSYSQVLSPASVFARSLIAESVVPALGRLVDPGVARVAPGVIQYKPAGPDSGLRSHQDASLVHEKTSAAVIAWIALTDITASDGALIVLPGSHRYGSWARVSTTTDDFDHLRPAIERHSRVLPVRAGQVILFDNAVIHGSLVNRGLGPRVAVTGIITPKASRIVIPVAAGVGDRDGHPTHATLRGSDPNRPTHVPPVPVGEWESLGTIALRPLTFGPRGLDAACRLHARLCPRAPGIPLGPHDTTA